MVVSFYEAYIRLKDLETKHGPSEFGRVCQILLGITLKKLGFETPIFQLAGRPDIRAVKKSEDYVIEVKATVDRKVTIKEEDLEGIRKQKGIPILAILLYPEPESKWIILKAQLVSCGEIYKTSLHKYSIKPLENKINKTFLSILEKYYEYAMEGTSSIKRIFDNYQI